MDLVCELASPSRLPFRWHSLDDLAHALVDLGNVILRRVVEDSLPLGNGFPHARTHRNRVKYLVTKALLQNLEIVARFTGASVHEHGHDVLLRRLQLFAVLDVLRHLHELGCAIHAGIVDRYRDDQYVGAAGRAVGDDTDDNTNTQRMQDETGANLPGSITENSDSLMSVGNTIHAQHYVNFFLALEQLTNLSDWAIGQPRAKATVESMCRGADDQTCRIADE